jgi:hypothetical protein
MIRFATLLFAAAICSTGVAYAGETEFLQSLDGSWRGSGTVRLRVNSSPMKVSCKFETDATGTSLALKGKCTSLLIFSRVIGADLQVDGEDYSGSYVGGGTGPAGLLGNRSGDAINLDIRWAKNVNGDRAAKMTIEKMGETGMRLTTIDTNQATGENIITSRIDLKRT